MWKCRISFCNRRERKCLHHIIWLHQSMLHRLLKAQPGLLLVLKTPDVEREGTRLLLDFREDQTRCLHLELIRDSRIFLVDRSPRVLVASLFAT